MGTPLGQLPRLSHDPRIPGAELVTAGLADLAQNRESVNALLVSIGAPRLRSLGIDVPVTLPDPEARLFALLTYEYGDGAHRRYKALGRRVVSFTRSFAHA
jgi:hypothetical protein